MAKLFARSKNGKMLKIGDSPEGSKWYFMTDAVINFFEGKFNNGDEVVIETTQQNGSAYITKITKAGSTNATPHQETTGSMDNNGDGFHKKKWVPRDEFIANLKKQKGESAPTTEKKTWGKSPEEQDSIKRQAIMHAVSRAMISMQGIITPDNVEEVAEKLYRKFQELVG